MKRSEMKELIKQELLKTVGGDAAKYIAEDILHIVENAGMLPPRYNREYRPLPSKVSFVTINEWEPEE